MHRAGRANSALPLESLPALLSPSGLGTTTALAAPINLMFNIQLIQ